MWKHERNITDATDVELYIKHYNEIQNKRHNKQA